MSQRLGDRDLTPGIAASVIADQFPDLGTYQVTYFSEGWDHWLFSVGDEWVARFPKRAERAAWLVREIEILAIAGETLGPRIPNFERIGRPNERFPYPFVVYRRLPGVGADQIAVTHRSALAKDLSSFLAALHRIEPRRITPPPARAHRGSWSRLRSDLMSVSGVLRPLLPSELRYRAEPYLAGEVPVPVQDGPRRFIHNDICPDHVIVNPQTGRLVGLIDLTDALVGEPVLDFVGLIGVGGRSFLDEVIAHYDLWRGDRFDEQLEWLTRTLTLTWLAEAATDDPLDIPKHLTWVDYAF